MIKEPKTFARPRLYYQEGWDYDSYYYGPRVRIIYPSGHAKWLSFCTEVDLVWADCCWNKREYTSGELSLKEATRYDNFNGFSPAEFLGEL